MGAPSKKTLAVLLVLALVVPFVAAVFASLIPRDAPDRWTGSDMRRWRNELAERNGGVDVPEAVHTP